MKKLSNMMNLLVARKENAKKNEDGLTLIELVVAIGIMLILSVGGLVGYNLVTDNARESAVDSAAAEVSTAVLVSLSDGQGTNDLTEAQGVVTDRAKDYDGKIDLSVSEVKEGEKTVGFKIAAEHKEGKKPTAERTVKP